MNEFDRDVTDIGVLGDEVRRELYLYVCAQPGPVGRDQAAEALGIPHHQAKFHLDRLQAAGLLEVSYLRLSGRTGPGAGRPSKVYRRASREVQVSLPGREYALAGELMAAAISRSMQDKTPIETALKDVARSHGRQLTVEPDAATDPLGIAAAALTRFGYEPRVEDGRMVLANCPFHALAQDHTELVCGMNEALLSGFCDQLEGVDAVLEPSPDRCCVVLRATAEAPRPASTTRH